MRRTLAIILKILVIVSCLGALFAYPMTITESKTIEEAASGVLLLLSLPLIFFMLWQTTKPSH